MAYESKYGNDETTKLMDPFNHTETHQMVYDFSVYIHRKVREMPHYEKFTLQQEIRHTVDELLDELEIYEKTKVISHLYSADRLNGRLIRKIRLAHDLGYSAINTKVYKYCGKEIRHIGESIGGLINKAQTDRKK